MKKVLLKKAVAFATGVLVLCTGTPTYSVGAYNMEQEQVPIMGIVPYSQLLVNNINVSSNDGFWERSFETVSSSTGNRLNLWHRNDTNNSVTVRIERRSGTSWVSVTSMTVSANSDNTKQIPMLSNEFNAQMRVTVTNGSGNPVKGTVSVRQTNSPLVF